MIAISLASDTSLYQINVLKFLMKLRRRPSVAPWHFLLHRSPLSDTKSCSLATVSNLHPTWCSTQAEPCFLLFCLLPQRRQWDWAVTRILICLPSVITIRQQSFSSSRNQDTSSAAFSLPRDDSGHPVTMQWPSPVQLQAQPCFQYWGPRQPWIAIFLLSNAFLPLTPGS